MTLTGSPTTSDETAKDLASVRRPAEIAHPCSPAASMTSTNAVSFPASTRDQISRSRGSHHPNACLVSSLIISGAHAGT